MFCSTIIPTIGRPELSRAVNSVLEQRFTAADFEVIVVNDSGKPLPPADWQLSDQVQIITTNRRERSVARNVGAAVATGRYLHFLDDDDWLLPDGLEIFWKLAAATNAIWLYGGARLIDTLSEQELTLHLHSQGNCFTQVMTGEWIPLQASFIKSDAFFVVGGFNPLMTQGEDRELCQRIALQSNFAYTEATVAVILRNGARTSVYPLGLEETRRGREKVLNEPHTFTRMRASACSGYWHGRMVRTYLASIIWNVQHERILTAVSRAIFGLLGFILTGQHLLTLDFWRAATKNHISGTV
jgi:glycosyltransferase involved in cell wall biosynthesis